MITIRSLISALAVMLLIATIGTIGYMVIESWSFVEGLYMTVITISTVGFKEVRPLDTAGQIFTIVLACSGVALMLLYVGILTQFIVEGQFRRIFGRRKVERAVSKLRNHYILCGAGRIGLLIAQELRKRNVPFVIVERNPERFEELLEQGYLVMQGDCQEEEILSLARIDRAQGLLLALASDAETVYTILTARQMNSDIFIIARASEVAGENKLSMAGANRVVSPYQTVSHRMVNATLRPEVLDMMELAMLDDRLDLAFEGLAVSSKSGLSGKTILESNIRGDFGTTIVAIKKPGGEISLSPSPNDRVETGDVLIVAGRREDVERLAQKVCG